MTDRELLEAAAKAGGVPGDYQSAAPGAVPQDCVAKGIGVPCWNSLTHDDECARLEAACDIDITWGSGCVSAQVNYPAIDVVEDFHTHGGDKNKARRYASTRAAAAMAPTATTTGEAGK